jgi:hypothetical protein
VVIKTGFKLKVVCRARTKPIDYDLDEPAQGSVAVDFRSGGTSYCTLFGPASVVRDTSTSGGGAGKFLARFAEASSCPTPPASCP